jgi:hypothetical protein
MGVTKAFRTGLAGLGLLAAANAASAQDAQPQHDKTPPPKHALSYSHEFLNYDSKLGDGQGHRDILNLKLNLWNDIELDALFRRSSYTGSSRLRGDSYSITDTTPGFDDCDHDDGDDGDDDGDGGFLDRHRNQRGRGHHSHGNGHGYGHSGGHHGGPGGNPGHPGDDPCTHTPGKSTTRTFTSYPDHTDVENYLEIGLGRKFGDFRLGAGFLSSDNLDARHLFRAEDVKGMGFKLGAGYLLDADTELGLEFRLMDHDYGENLGLTGRVARRLGPNDSIVGELATQWDDLRECTDYKARLAWRHVFNPDVAVKLGVSGGYEDFMSKGLYKDQPTWGAFGGIEGRLYPGVYLNFQLNYDTGALDEMGGSVGLSLKW